MGGEEPGRERDNSLTSQSSDEQNRLAQMRMIGLALQFAFTILGSFIIFGWLGLWLDGRFGTKPLFLLIGVVLSFIAIGYNLYEIATVKFPQRKPTAASSAKKSMPRPPAKGWDDAGDEEEWPVRPRTGTRDKGE
jgi:F0F1-type ATP synthase assembly protein I